MFIKVTQSCGGRYAQLVESFRNEQGQPLQRTVCTLGIDDLTTSWRRPQNDVDVLSCLRLMVFKR